jgi:hypothetical protein
MLHLSPVTCTCYTYHLLHAHATPITCYMHMLHLSPVTCTCYTYHLSHAHATPTTYHMHMLLLSPITCTCYTYHLLHAHATPTTSHAHATLSPITCTCYTYQLSHAHATPTTYNMHVLHLSPITCTCYTYYMHMLHLTHITCTCYTYHLSPRLFAFCCSPNHVAFLTLILNRNTLIGRAIPAEDGESWKVGGLLSPLSSRVGHINKKFPFFLQRGGAAGTEPAQYSAKAYISIHSSSRRRWR